MCTNHLTVSLLYVGVCAAVGRGTPCPVVVPGVPSGRNCSVLLFSCVLCHVACVSCPSVDSPSTMYSNPCLPFSSLITEATKPRPDPPQQPQKKYGGHVDLQRVLAFSCLCPPSGPVCASLDHVEPSYTLLLSRSGRSHDHVTHVSL